jgi:hypothetical protein
VRTVRAQKALAFMQVNDGSSLGGIQVVVEPGTPGFELFDAGGGAGALTTGASVRATGTLVASPGAKQAVELRATSLELIGGCDAEAYPLQKKRHTLEFLRGVAHLRPRTNTIGAVARVRRCVRGGRREGRLIVVCDTCAQSRGLERGAHETPPPLFSLPSLLNTHTAHTTTTKKNKQTARWRTRRTPFSRAPASSTCTHPS